MPQPPAKLKELENSLHRVYLRIFKEIKKEPDYPDNLPAIQRKYNKLVYDNTRSAVQQSVIFANEKVNRVFKTEPYLTQSDLDLIKKNTDEQFNSFWRKIMLDVFRKQEQRLTGGAVAATFEGTEDDVNLEPPPPPDIDMTAYLLAVATASLFNSFSDSTLSKTTELADTIETKPKVKWIATVDQTTCKQLSDGGEGCGTRNNRIYEIDDPELQIHMPGSGTHPYCRCYLETII
jgi:hypothetical protein